LPQRSSWLSRKSIPVHPCDDVIFYPFRLVSFISTNLTLLPGDVILTGTPSGIGPIKSGDRLEVRVQGLAPLINTVR
jgi:2-keto-4-pentenoate hydratase/2-oxohepta-3-ene-1,7-dioic acid hydratase in catechol pathway